MARVEAAEKLLSLQTVPTIRLEHLTPAQRQAYILADNRLAELAGWDKEVLAIELQHLLTFQQDFDITVTGFETPEIDLLIEGLDAEADPDDEIPASDANEPTVSVAGDLAAARHPQQATRMSHRPAPGMFPHEHVLHFISFAKY